MNIIILGAGEIGYHIALSLSRENREVILVESDPRRADQIDEDDNDVKVLRGNAADPDVLLRAGLKDADLLVAVTDSDESNLAACFFAARLSPSVRRVARIRQLDTRIYGELLTAEPALVHAVIHPEELCAGKILDVLRYPAASDVNWFFGGRAVLVSLTVKPDSPVNGWDLIQIGQARAKQNLPFLIAALSQNETARVPSATDKLQSGDTLYLATLTDHMNEVMAMFCPSRGIKAVRDVTIFGGGRIGLYLAELLESHKIGVKIIEPDAERALFLSERLEKSLVLCGEPSERGIFDEEKIADSDAFVAVTSDQEDNLIAALYAKSSGVSLGVTVLYRAHLSTLVRHMGIDTVILPQQIAVGKILEHVRAGNISSVIVLDQQGMEVIEALVPPGSRLLDKPLSRQHMPQGALLLALQRDGGETIIPDGNTIIMAGDRVAVISRQRDVPKVEAMLRG